MLPDKHINDLESSRKRRKIIKHTLTSATFLISFLLLGPIVHEIGHIAPLELIGCAYTVDLNFQFLTGLYATVQPLCYPSDGFLSVFYAAGYVSTFMAGWGLILGTHRTEGKFNAYTAAAGTGMLLSILLSIGSKGDVANFLRIAGLDTGLGVPVSIIVMLAVLLVSFSGVEMLLES